MKIFKNIFILSVLGEVMTFMSSCHKNDYGPSYINGVYEKQLAGNLERPAGLSYNYDSKNNDLSKCVFVQGPLFFKDGPKGKIDPTRSKNPVIYQLSGNLDNLNLNPLLEVDLGKYLWDFLTAGDESLGNSMYRPVGLTLDDLVLKDGSILFSANNSDRIYKVNSSGLETYVDDPSLENIVDMIQARDGKIYVVEAQKDWFIDGPVVPKEVFSVDNSKDVKKEFELLGPSGYSPWWIASYNWAHPHFLLERLKIIENSELGKEKSGAEFYVSDMSKGTIYQIDKDRNVTVLADGLRYPSSLAVDSAGDIFYTISPLLLKKDSANTEYPTELFMLNPETKSSISIHKFDEKTMGNDILSGAGLYVLYEGDTCILPVGFNVTNILYESADKFDFLFTNSHEGTLKWVSVYK